MARGGPAGMIAGLRPRTAPEIIDAAVQLARRDYGALFVSVLPVFVAYMVISRVLGTLRAPSYAYLPVSAMMGATTSAVGVAIGAAAYEGRRLPVGDAYRQLAGRAWPALVAGSYRGLLAVLGLAILVVPGLFVTAIYAPVMAVAMLEPRRGAWATLRRSRDLTRGEKRRCVYAFALPWLAMYGAQAGIMTLTARTIGSASPLVAMTVTTLLYAAITPVMVCLQVVLYYDLRVRKEAFDIEMMLAAEAAAA